MSERKHTPRYRRYPDELCVHGIRLFKENRPDYSSDSAAYALIAEKRGWWVQAERDISENLNLKIKHIPKVADIFLSEVVL